MTTLTKDAIKQSFMKLLNQKSLSKITVKEIVEDCGITIITTTSRRLLRKS